MLEFAQILKGIDLNKHQAHGLTLAEMKLLKERQAAGKVEMIHANNHPRYMIPIHEKHLMHLSSETLVFNESTGNKTSKPKIHTLSVKDFEQMSKSVKLEGEKINPENAFAGKKVIIYHDARKEKLESNYEMNSFVEEISYEDKVKNMSEIQLRDEYLNVFGHKALPSDSISVLKELILENKGE